MKNIKGGSMSTSNAKQYMTFNIEEVYGIELKKIKEIIRYQELTKVPETPEFILGVLSLRGIAVPIINLRNLLKLEEKKIDEYSVIIVMEISGRLIGLLVDSVSDMISIEDSEIKKPMKFSNKNSRRFVDGMVERDNKFIMLFAVDKLFSSDEIDLIDGI